MAESTRVTALIIARFRFGCDFLSDADSTNRRTETHEVSRCLSLRVSSIHLFCGSPIKGLFFGSSRSSVRSRKSFGLLRHRCGVQWLQRKQPLTASAARMERRREGEMERWRKELSIRESLFPSVSPSLLQCLRRSTVSLLWWDPG